MWSMLCNIVAEGTSHMSFVAFDCGASCYRQLDCGDRQWRCNCICALGEGDPEAHAGGNCQGSCPDPE